MNRETVVERLNAHAGELRAQGVSAIHLFGSMARDGARRGSDVDLFFDYDDPMIGLVRVSNRIGAILRVEADVMTRDSLHPRLKERIEASAARVF